ncbi:unnamed protein product [Angiostrongylus costaricensis]|uniref:ANK_REP_REGION domain-containing protein n=1 Tax=Angiostrongylus costaricensis TaxID=334426 RepID=A0A158PG24_ANGCS|nr:unnamed protein product [Angiostrongylus costaricensis]
MEGNLSFPASSTSLQFMDLPTPCSGFATTNNTTAIVNTLVRHGANVDAADAYGLTPLHYAAMKGNQQAAQALLMNCATVNSKGVKGMTPLLTACVHGSDDIVRLLLSSGADWSTTDSRMNSVYHITAMNERNNTLKLLLQYGMLFSGYDPRLRDDDMQLPLHEAASKNRAHVVELLVKLAKVMFLSVIRHLDIIKAHISIIPDVINLVDVRLLERKSFWPDTIEDKTDYGMTPLLSAVCSDALEVVKILIGQNADICATDNDGRTAIFIGAKFNAIKVLRYLLDLCRQKDCESGSIPDLVNHPDHNQMTAMHVVCNNGYIEVSKLLHEYGASIDTLNEEEETPLHLAAASGETVSVRQLLDWDKRLVLLRNEDADTPLHLAAKNEMGHDTFPFGECRGMFGIADERRRLPWKSLTDSVAANYGTWDRRRTLALARPLAGLIEPPSNTY